MQEVIGRKIIFASSLRSGGVLNSRISSTLWGLRNPAYPLSLFPSRVDLSTIIIYWHITYHHIIYHASRRSSVGR